MQTSNSNSGGEFTTQIKSWWATAPFFVKFTTYASIAIYILSFFISVVNIAFPVVPGYIIYNFQWYMLFGFFFGAFYPGSLITLLISFFAYLSGAAPREKARGTLRDIVDFLFKNLEISLSHVVLSFVLGLFMGPSALMMPFNGLWPIFFTYLTERCLADPEGVSGLFGLPFKIKNKYYPAILLGLFCLLSQRLMLPYILGALVGLFHQSYFDKYYLAYLNDQRMSRWEQSKLVACIRIQPQYVAVGSATGQLPQATQTQAPSPNVNEPPRQVVIPFTGKGVAIGSNTSATNTNTNINRGGQQNTYAELLDDSSDLERQGH